jgi:hypothetical protein
MACHIASDSVDSAVGEVSVYSGLKILVQPRHTNISQGQDLLLECKVIPLPYLLIYA